MIGSLPDSLIVAGKRYAIRTDFRNFLRIIEAFGDSQLTNEEKVYVFLKRVYVEFDSIPQRYYEEAYKQASEFMEWQKSDDKKHNPRLYDWTKDEQLIFPAVNKVAGMEVRALPYLHWWTFLGYFQSIDSESLWGTVLSIRQKRAKGKKLEKWEREFYNNNRELCSIVKPELNKSPEDTLQDIFKSLIEEGERLP